MYDTVNRSKKHGVLDLATQGGRRKMLALLDTADILLTNVPSAR